MRTFVALAASLLALVSASSSADIQGLEDSFRNPPSSAKPWVYWFWINGNITREGITADLEAMKRVGIGGVLIMEVDQGVPAGPVAFMSDEWRELFQHVIAEAKRLGLEVNMNNDAGWNGSGGPWILPEQSMQKVVWCEVEVEGPTRFDAVLPQPETIAGFYKDIAVQAFPTPGDYRIEDIQHKACFVTGFVYPSIPGEIPVEMCVEPARLTDLSTHMDATGHLAWDVPPGRWTIMRFGHTSTGVENAPAPPSGRGLECDKLSKDGIEAHFNGMMAKLIADSGDSAGPVLSATHIDSWENGAQNWTARMREEFQKRRGYDLLPYLPVMSGRVVGNLEISERFLWDLRQTISDLLVENYAGHLSTLAKQHGMKLTIEAYGGPCDDLVYAGRADEPMSEFWVGGNALSVCKEMSSAAHIYGKPILGAESFTANDRERWLEHPATLKPLGDQAFCLGVNRFVVHRYALQPWTDRKPGMTMGPWGVHYERTQTWWELSAPWHQYLARCQHLLRQGRFVADICYLQPEAAPQGFHEHNRNGYDYDSCSADAVLTRMSVSDGKIVLPDGMQYRMLVLPNVPTMTPDLVRAIRGLVQAGATIVGPRPLKSPSLSGYPECDQEVARIASEVWGDCDGVRVKQHAFGKGRVVCGMVPEDVLARDGVRPDFASAARLEYIHRRVDSTDVYFVANPRPVRVTAACAFRISGKRPHVWHPENGRTEPAAVFAANGDSTNLALELGPCESVFVVFSDGLAAEDPVVALTRDEVALLSAADIWPTMTIRKAVYGVPGEPNRTRDVRDAVQRKVDVGDYHFQIAQMAESGDPAVNEVKMLSVEYEVGGRRLSVKGQDPDTVHLTSDTAAITVEKALYGILNDPARTRDVREKLQHILDTGESSFQVARLAQGDDPAVGIVKTLELTYTVEGRHTSLSATDADRIHLYEAPEAEQPAGVHIGEEGTPVLEVRANGHYTITTASGEVHNTQVDDIPRSLAVEGPWEVHFPSGTGAPGRVKMHQLIPLNEHEDPGVRYFSGEATYSTNLDVPQNLLGAERRIYLDLGKVQVIARIALNGTGLGTLWKPPFRMDITSHIRPGTNTLEIRVANLWVNRLIGDEQLPEDTVRSEEGALAEWPQWLLDGQRSPAGRIAFSTWRLWRMDEPLHESGLIGPVTLQVTKQITLGAG
ncbi:MAG: hypothetical protein IT365_03855 [Candidatus Hydrogenedentes bacterium]|nr:hypothetical protein [Candidatus Hydrogenedentota bacterium]